ncbi:MAG: hypothetical protein LBJ25_05370 [Candidatus Margulisbacteria bacterium]|jgi:hypothetical protein|nr:hypothetical protein [Candidatus Margulisiibacteriota bacterium]
MKWLSAKLWEYSELPRPYAYPLKGQGKKLAELSWEDFQDISDAHWRKLLADIYNIDARSLIVDFADDKVCYDVEQGFVFLACYAGDPDLSWESAKLFLGIINKFQQAAVRYEQTLKTSAEKNDLYRKIDERLLFLRGEVSFHCFWTNEMQEAIERNLTTLLGIYREKLQKIKPQAASDITQFYSLVVSVDIH